ncbi:MAG: hypothetical protein ACXWIU_11045, partial [Limisphaerales bacterium]
MIENHEMLLANTPRCGIDFLYGLGLTNELADRITWDFTGRMHDARAFHTATLLSYGQVLIVGGRGFNSPK